MIGNPIKKIYRSFFAKKPKIVQVVDIKVYSDRIISDGVLLNEIPSPTEMENERGEFIRKRLYEFGYDNIITDEIGNILVLLQGNVNSDKYLLIYSDMDNIKYSAIESIVEIREKKLFGIGIGDNSIGASTLLVLCEYIKKNNTSFDINLAILFSHKNIPENDFEGINFFLKKWNEKIFSSIYLFGLHTGKLVLNSFGIVNMSFLFKSGNTDSLGKNFTDSTVDIAANLYNEINKINWSEFNAIVNIVRISTGIGFEYFPSEGTMDIEIFSKEHQSLDLVKTKIISLATEICKRKNCIIEDQSITYISPSIDKLNENLINIAKKVHSEIGIVTKTTEIPDYTTIISKYNIPSITLGITSGEKTMETEFIETKNILNGFKQVLYFIDEINKLQMQEIKNG